HPVSGALRSACFCASWGDIFMTTLTGDGSDNTFDGTSGSDSLSGLGGNDSLSGLGGDDTLDGGTGNNTIDAGGGTDLALFDFSDRSLNLVFLNGAAPGVTYAATVGGSAAGSVTNTEAVSITGGSGNDLIGGVYTTEAFNGGLLFLDGVSGNDTAVADVS